MQEKSYKVQWDRLWRVPLTSKHRPFVINMFDEIFILDDNRVILFLIKTSQNETYGTLQQVDSIEEHSAIKFVRVL